MGTMTLAAQVAERRQGRLVSVTGSALVIHASRTAQHDDCGFVASSKVWTVRAPQLSTSRNESCSYF